MAEVEALVRQGWARNRPLAVLVAGMIVTAVVALVGLVVDPRIITGAPAWLKPTKFALSITIFSVTLGWLLTHVKGHERLVGVISWATAVSLGVEMALIGGAAAAGVTSHYNVATTINTIVWSSMAFFIVVVWIMTLLTAGLLLRQRLPDRAMAWSLRLGLVIGAVGMSVAFFMTAPTPDQLATAETGAGMPVAGAHSVGVDDGGPGLPVVGWSTEGGDLRVGHFFGLHALQALPLLGWGISRFRRGRLGDGHRVGLVWTGGLVYLGIVLLATWQALRGQPLIRPDGLTLAALAALLLLGVAAAFGILTHGRRTAGASSPGT